MATIKLTPSTYYVSNSALSVENANNMYNNTDNTTYATITNTVSGTTSYYIYLRGFNFNDIPSNVNINSFTIRLKISEQGCNTGGNYVPRLCNDTTTLNGTCNVLTTSIQTLEFTSVSSNFEDIISYGDNFGIRITCRRAQRSTTGYVYIYGAEIEVDYTLIVYHDITSTLNTNKIDSIDPLGTISVLEGTDYVLRIDGDSITGVTITDNNIDASNQLVLHTGLDSYSDSTVLGTYSLVSGSFSGNGADYFQGLVGSGANSAQTSSNYYASSGNIVVFTYNFDFENIPSNAVITRLYCEINGHAESISNSNEYMCAQIRSGDTQLSTELNFKDCSTSNTTQTIEATTLPTVSQLSDLVLYCRLGYYGGAINGATCYIEYDVPITKEYWTYTVENVVTNHTIIVGSNASESIYMKVNGNWIQCSKVYKKINGLWVEQSNLTNVFDLNTIYINGTN